MIRFTCPECQRGFKVADEHAGKSVRCPGCKSVTRLPEAKAEREQEAEAVPPPRKVPRPQPVVEAPPRKKGRPPEPEEDLDERPRRDEEDEDDVEERPRKKKKKKKKSAVLGGSAFLIAALGLAVLYLVMGLLGFFFKGGAIAMMVVGLVPIAIGTWWIQSIAREEGTFQYFACLYIPFYDTWFSLKNWSQTWAPCVLCWIGRLFAISALLLLIVHMVRDKPNDGGWSLPTPAMTPAEVESECLDLLKARDAVEAKTWLAAPGRRIQTVEVGRLPLRSAVDGLYQQGAVRVTFAEMMSDEDGDDPMHLIVELPTDKAKRQGVLNFANTQLREPDEPMQTDQGQKYLLILTN